MLSTNFIFNSKFTYFYYLNTYSALICCLWDAVEGSKQKGGQVRGPGRSGGVGCRFITRWLAADDLWWSCFVHSRDESSPTEKQILVVMDSNRGARLDCWHSHKIVLSWVAWLERLFFNIVVDLWLPLLNLKPAK